MTLDRPWSPELSARSARDAYLAENGFSVETYDAQGSTVTVLGFDFYRPLTPRARWAIRLHDLHHVLTGYGTDLVGEAEVSAWEVRRGTRGLGLYVRGIVFGAFLLGFFVAPRRTFAAWRGAGRGPSLFTAGLEFESLLSLDVHTLREQLGVPVEGVARIPRQRHPHAPPLAA
jgi:hypothetical protein